LYLRVSEGSLHCWSPLKLLDNISDADIQKDDGAAATKQATTMLGSLAAEMTNLFGAS
jgi:hypothetical protein